jgi:hypothetical protein
MALSGAKYTSAELLTKLLASSCGSQVAESSRRSGRYHRTPAAQRESGDLRPGSPPSSLRSPPAARTGGDQLAARCLQLLVQECPRHVRHVLGVQPCGPQQRCVWAHGSGAVRSGACSRVSASMHSTKSTSSCGSVSSTEITLVIFCEVRSGAPGRSSTCSAVRTSHFTGDLLASARVRACARVRGWCGSCRSRGQPGPSAHGPLMARRRAHLARRTHAPAGRTRCRGPRWFACA